MLTLFDGFSTGKKMFIVTCNSLYDLNDYLVNRPGRFLYHFRFDYPTAEEITQYLQDKLEESFFVLSHTSLASENLLKKRSLI